jgi:hypothetical protein
LLFVVAFALASSCGLAGAASRTASAASITGRLTKTVFQSSQARSVKVVYRFSRPSRHFSYLLTIRKGSKWLKVKSVKKTGTFKGTKSMTVKMVFAGKPIKLGRYRLKLTPDKGSKQLGFSVVKTVPGLVPAPFFSPEISGTAKQGSKLTVWRGTWKNSPSSYTYQWRRCDTSGANCSDIEKATKSEYVPVYTDAGSTVRVVVTAKNSHGSGSTTTNRTAVVVGLAPANIDLPKISGTFDTGATLTATEGTWSNSPTSYAFQWRLCTSSIGSDCHDIPGEIISTYSLQSADTSNTILAVVTASNPYGSASETDAISKVVPAPTAVPVISGSTSVGQTLSTSNGVWNIWSTSYAYQWQRCNSGGASASCVNISGATASSCTLVSGDENSTFRVEVTASNLGGSVIAISALTAVVTLTA